MGESFQPFLILFLNSGFWGWLSTESQPQNPEFGGFLWLLWFNFSPSKDNWPFKIEIVDIYRHTASFKFWFSKVQDFGNFELSPMIIGKWPFLTRAWASICSYMDISMFLSCWWMVICGNSNSDGNSCFVSLSHEWEWKSEMIAFKTVQW